MCQLLSLSHSPCGLFSLVRHVRLIISCLICKKEKVNHIVLNQTWNFMARLTHWSLPKKKIWYHTSRFPSFWDKTSASKILPYSNVYPGFLITQQANRSISDHFPYSSCSKLLLSINVEVHMPYTLSACSGPDTFWKFWTDLPHNTCFQFRLHSVSQDFQEASDLLHKLCIFFSLHIQNFRSVSRVRNNYTLYSRSVVTFSRCWAGCTGVAQHV